MNLNNLSEWIDPVILERGRDYFLEGRVVDLASTSDGVHCARVEGSEDYEVAVLLNDSGEVLHLGCDCPYDFGPVCKHEVALLLTLLEQKDVSGFEVETKTDDTLGRLTTLEQQLENESKERLINILLRLASHNEIVAKQLQLYLTESDENEALLRYMELIQHYISSFEDDGFVEWRHVEHAVEGAELVAEKAIEAFEREEWEQAVKINLCVIREMVDFLQMADDSSGIVGAVIDQSFENISEVIIQKHHFLDAENDGIFQLLLKESKHAYYEGWPDCQLNLVKMASDLVSDSDMFESWEQHVAQLFSERDEKDSWSSNYVSENLAFNRYHLFYKLMGENAAWAYLMEHLEFTEFRELAIEKALQEGNHEAAIRLAEEGEQKDNKLRGLVSKWKHYRFEAYTRSDQLEKQRQLGIEFILDGDFTFYKLIKETYTMEEWTSIYPKLLDQMDDKWPRDIYWQILLEEQELERLLVFVKKDPSKIEHFYTHLIQDFPKEVDQLFVTHIEKKAADANNRKAYTGVCKVIKMYKRIVGKNEAFELINTLSLKYPRRPAFQDELKKIAHF